MWLEDSVTPPSLEGLWWEFGIKNVREWIRLGLGQPAVAGMVWGLLLECFPQLVQAITQKIEVVQKAKEVPTWQPGERPVSVIGTIHVCVQCIAHLHYSYNDKVKLFHLDNTDMFRKYMAKITIFWWDNSLPPWRSSESPPLQPWSQPERHFHWGWWHQRWQRRDSQWMIQSLLPQKSLSPSKKPAEEQRRRNHTWIIAAI